MPRKPKWKPVLGRADQSYQTKHASAIVWRSGEGWRLDLLVLFPTEEAAKAAAEKWMKEAKP